MKRVRASSMVWRTASTPWTDRYETLAVEGVRSDEVKPRSGWRLDRFGGFFVGGLESVRLFGLPVRAGVFPARKSASRLLGCVGYRSVVWVWGVSA